jgi:hypothetical protein
MLGNCGFACKTGLHGNVCMLIGSAWKTQMENGNDCMHFDRLSVTTVRLYSAGVRLLLADGSLGSEDVRLLFADGNLDSADGNLDGADGNLVCGRQAFVCGWKSW